MHTLMDDACVHSWMMHALNKEPDANMARHARRCVASRIPHRGRANYSLVQRRLLLHADHCSSHMSALVEIENGEEWIPESLGLLYADQGRLSEAEAMYTRALQGYVKAWGPEHVSTLHTVNGLGNLYSDQGWLSEAEAIYNRAL
ncbi:hypothetical protein BKA56DRAFT_716988 [Ilyonectria sp. MPI-CAGE-AT-0026]|nr:hypothetical protein BKA56DRAFT_716988 [Ilyonectria sp. MPI-CAGE-AT-0026]